MSGGDPEDLFKFVTSDFERTMQRFYSGPAHALARNIVVIAIGFVPMLFSSLMPYITVGAFFFAIMLVSGLTTLFSLPAILSLGHRAFFSAPKETPLAGTTSTRGFVIAFELLALLLFTLMIVAVQRDAGLVKPRVESVPI